MARSLLTCPICAQPGFASVDSLRLGLVSAATRHLVCPVCQEVLLGLDKFTIHLFGHSLQQQKRTQPEDPKVEEVLLREKQESGSKKAAANCDLCGFDFADEILLQLHRQLVHATQRIPVQEPTLAPKSQVGEATQPPPPYGQEPPTQQPAKVEKASFPCHLCAKAFKMRGSLMVHLRVAHSGINAGKILKNWVESTQQQQQLQQPQQQQQQQNSDSRNYSCTTCSKSFKKEQQLNQHQRTHEGKQWECEVCSKLFTTKYFLKKHKRLHTGEMPYSCPTCNKTFTFQQSYHKHLLYHSDEKPHVCNECDRAFKELSTLHNHQRIHTGEKPFACETCGKCFRQRVSYLVHRRIHTGAMPYRCTACGKSFRYKVSQRTHKCPSQPPGTVVRQNGQLVERLLQGTQQNATPDSEEIKRPVNRENTSNSKATDNKEEKVTESISTSSQELPIQPNNQFIIFVDSGMQPGLPHSVLVAPTLFMLPQNGSQNSSQGWVPIESTSITSDKQNPQISCESISSTIRDTNTAGKVYDDTNQLQCTQKSIHNTHHVSNELSVQNIPHRQEKKDTADDIWLNTDLSVPQIPVQSSKHSPLPNPDSLVQTTDFFSMVMTPPPPAPPLSANLPSPSECFKQLSLTTSDNLALEHENTIHKTHTNYQFCMSSLLSSSLSPSSATVAEDESKRQQNEVGHLIHRTDMDSEETSLSTSISENLVGRCENDNTSSPSRVLQTINEESLKQLLYGTSL